MRYLFILFTLFGLLLSSCADNPIPAAEEQNEEEQESVLPKLHVVGRTLRNDAGETINLHGFAQTYSPFFNQSAWNNYDVAGCLRYNQMLINGILTAGWKMNFVRMHMDPYWSDDPSKPSVRYEGHERFSTARFKKYLDEVFIPMAKFANDKGLYVVFRPPGVSPEKIAVGDDYNLFLEEVWSIVSAHPQIKNNNGIMFELANEPINILGPNGTYSSSGQGHFDRMKLFCQRIVDKIRANADNIIWVPGLAYQSSFSGFANNPVEGNNIGYAVHAYPGWYGSDTEEASPELGGTMGGGYESFQQGWNAQVKPVADFAPIMVTEMDWAPAKYDASWGKSFTGTVGGPGFGANFKYIADMTGGERYLIAKAIFADGSIRHVTSETRFQVSDESILRIDENGIMHALRDGTAMVTASYTSPSGDTGEAVVNVRATTFPLTTEMFNPSIFEEGSFDEETKTLITGPYGFGGWWYNKGVDLSSYQYLIAELGNENESGVSLRLFDENNYWSQPALYDFGNERRVIVDLHNMHKQVGDQQVKLDPTHIYIIGFWSSGNKPIVIKNVYLSDTTP